VPESDLKPRAIIVLNPAARHGTALARFSTVSDLLRQRFDARVIPTDLQGVWWTRLRQEMGVGADVVLAAGGDGTVGAVASELLGSPKARHVALGAVGLGSSNDFHKPFGATYSGVPLRIDLGGASLRDVGRATYSTDGELPMERTFLVSASLGITARANALFNEGRAALLRFLKRRWVDGAVFYAALAALTSHVNVRARVRLEAEESEFELSNLSVLKTPFLSGCLHYDTPIVPDSGLLAANLCHGMSRTALVRTLLGLVRGHFAERPLTRHWLSRRVDVVLRSATPLELDGEVVRARRVSFDVLPRRILTCA
jgi:diacylglycerol kinase (ATP)